MIYDAAIIGTGPAGVSAAINLKILKKNFIWLGSKNLSDKIQKAERISNYPGLPAISGKELNDAFLHHIESMEIEITDRMVNAVYNMGTHYALMAGSDYYEAKTVILTSGVAGTSQLKGESDKIGKGVSYCATCDGALYRDRTIAVVCNAKRFEHEVEYLAGLAKTVYYFPSYKEVQITAENVEIMKTRIREIAGEDRVSAVVTADGQTIDVDGVFCLRTSVALSTLLPDLKSEGGHIVTDRTMATNLPGVFAAGDCTGRPYQYTKAVGEGNIAAHSAVEWLAKNS